VITPLSVDCLFSVYLFNGSGNRTGLQAEITAQAFFGIMYHLFAKIMRLGIKAPQAPHRASLKKDQRPYPWAVVQGVPLVLEKKAL
jgi:hypothetical protein